MMTKSEAEELGTFVEITQGTPTDEELAGLGAVIVALFRERPKPHAPTTGTLGGGWHSLWATIRQPILPGRDAWRGSFRS